jgi:Concanavalin A-like lectin/glucanases superfamily
VVVTPIRKGPLLIALCCATGCAPDRLQAVELRADTLRRELLAHWRFDDAAGSVARDDSGNGRPGELTGARTWLTDGRFGGALHLGDGEFVSVPRFPDATSSFTTSAWVRFPTGVPATTAKWTTVISTEDTGGWEINVGHDTMPAPLHFGFWVGPNQGDYDGFTCTGAPLDRWSQVAFVIDTTVSMVSVYRDGILCQSGVTEHNILPGSATLTIGAWPLGGRYLVGDVDDIAVWGRALEPAEVALLALESP